MKKKLEQIENNQTRELVSMSSKKTIHVKYVCKLKLSPNGEVTNYKARLVAKGFLQIP